MTSHLKHQPNLDIDPGHRLPYYYEDGTCLELRMIQYPHRERMQLNRCISEDKGIEDRSRLHATLQHRFEQGKRVFELDLRCPICRKNPIVWFIFCIRRKPEVSIAHTSCDECNRSHKLEAAVVKQAPDSAYPMTILQLAYISALSRKIPIGPAARRVIDFLLSLRGFPPAEEMTPENAVRFFNEEPPQS